MFVSEMWMSSDIQKVANLVEPQSVAGELVCCFAPLRLEDWEPDGLAPDGVRRGDEAVPAFLPRRNFEHEMAAGYGCPEVGHFLDLKEVPSHVSPDM